MTKLPITVVASVCIYVCTAVLSYMFNDAQVRDGDSVIDIGTLESELLALEDQIQVLESAEPLMPVEKNWLTVQRIVARYPELIWRASEALEIASETENAWGAVMIASPDLLLPVMRSIQSTVPAEVSEIQLDRRQGVLLINILGTIK